VIRQINLTLEGPVAELMAQYVPELKSLPRRGVLERVLDDPLLLDRCFQAFRAHPDRFAMFLVDRRDQPVERGDVALSCGRSLDEVMAMVVRTCAKRHFRRRLDGAIVPLQKRGRAAAPEAEGVMERLVRLFSQRSARAVPHRTRGEVLYDAFKEHLLHDWQVPLVPEYSTLSPQLVRRLGRRILDYRVAEDIRRLRDDPEAQPGSGTADALPAFLTGAALSPPAPPVSTAPPVSSTAPPPASPPAMAPPPAAPPPAAPGDRRARLAEILTPDQKRLRGAAFTMVLLDPAVRAHLPNPEQTVRISTQLAETGGLAARMLVGELGLRADQLAVLVLTLHSLLGEAAFGRVFGVAGNPEQVAAVIERARAAGLGQDTDLGEVAAFARRLFGGVRPPPPPQG